jgi:hypothetical protein
MLRLFSITMLCCGLLYLSNATSTADEKKPAAPTAEQQAEMMKAYMAHATPGKEHAELAKSVGDWNCEIESYETGTPAKSSGTAKRTMILGGRFLQEEFKGTHMGQPFDGLMLLGYDNTTKKFGGFWADSMSTSVSKLTSTECTDTVCKMDGTGTCPLTKEEMTFHTSTTKIDDNKLVFEMRAKMPGADKESLMMKITYTRKK